MTHREMKRFRTCLDVENVRRLESGMSVIEPFYPSDFLKARREKPAGQSASQGNRSAGDLPDGMGRFVFLRGTESDIEQLVRRDHSTGSYIRLRYYLDTDGRRAVVPDRMMQSFFDACLQYRGQFEVTPSIDGIEKKDKVELKTGPFAGHEASVISVRHSKGAIHLQLAIQMVAGVMTIQMSDVKPDQVVILNRNAVDAIRADFIEYTQNHLLTILEHRVKRVKDKEVNQQDAAMLTRLFRYRHHRVENESASNHFLALMLICAHLCRLSADEEVLRQRVLDSLEVINRKSESKAATDTRAYLWIALYVSTHDPVYRDAAKQYVRDHQPKSERLRRFVSLIRTGKKI